MFRSTGARIGLAAAALTGCSAAAPVQPQPVFDLMRFFSGKTHGDGSLKIVFKSAQTVRVEGNGQVDRDGTLVLDQIVTRGSGKPEPRRWRIRSAGPGHFIGTLSDATGPVEGDVQGNRLHLRYPMKGGVNAEQWISLQPGGRTALNRMAITKFGIAVAHLDETIRKLD